MISLKNHKVSVILLTTVLIGVISTSLDISNTERFIHINGREGHRLNYAFYFISQYVIGLLIVSALFFKTSQVDKWVIINYLFWDFIGFLSYLYMGWPEPKMLIIIGFSVGIGIFLSMQIFKG